jgi:hypothetical protein
MRKKQIYIALDYPLNKSHWEGYNKINRYLEKVEGFKTVTVVKRDKNFGVFENFKEARREIFNINDRFILSEDDNYYSPNFLDYINKGLDKFNITDDTLFCMNMVKNDLVCVFPVMSKVRNYGLDGTGEHGGFIQSDIYRSQLIDPATTFNFELSNKGMDESKEISMLLRKHFGQSKKSRLFTFFKYILFKFRLLYR